MDEIIQQAGCLHVENHILRIIAKVTGYEGGYPIVEFTIKDAAWDLVKDKKKFPRIVRSSEMEGGIEVGVSTCFYRTASLEWDPPVMRICGYPEVINRILGKVM